MDYLELVQAGVEGANKVHLKLLNSKKNPDKEPLNGDDIAIVVRNFKRQLKEMNGD